MVLGYLPKLAHTADKFPFFRPGSELSGGKQPKLFSNSRHFGSGRATHAWGEPEQLQGVRVSANSLRRLGRPGAGKPSRPSRTRSARRLRLSAIVCGKETSRPIRNVLGRSLTLNGRTVTVSDVYAA